MHSKDPVPTLSIRDPYACTLFVKAEIMGAFLIPSTPITDNAITVANLITGGQGIA